MHFEIKEEFYFDGKPERIISGAVHYFRITPGKWRQSLHNLKAMGANTVETYVPWNLHEPKKGTFHFEGIADLPKFLDIATEMGLYIILRPATYICAEWDFGGFPAWLLEECDRVRSQDPKFMAAVDAYYKELIPRVVDYQFTRGGKMIMVQVENEYGSYSDDKEYLRMNRDLLVKYGIEVPFVTSDGGWDAVLEAGTMMEEGVLPTANFGSKAKPNFEALQRIMDKYHVQKPYMCMEFWDGWFDNWGNPVIRRDAQETADAFREILELGSVNMFMFHGGTNFAFWNGANESRQEGYKPQITSYDYDAPLNEHANPTEKYDAFRKVIQEMYPNKKLLEPIISEATAYEPVDCQAKVSLFETLETVGETTTHDVTKPMEKLGQGYGYILYDTVNPLQKGSRRFEIVDANDRIQVYRNQEHVLTQIDEEIGEEFVLNEIEDNEHLQVLVENRGRTNYGPYLTSPRQSKGIRGGIRQDLFFISKIKHTTLPLETDATIDFSKPWKEKVPAFYQFELEITGEPTDTFIDMSDLGKGNIFVNGVNIGRYWDIGPYYTMYVPYDLLKEGKNRITVFETEGVEVRQLVFTSEPKTLEPKE
ncbi:glycoside hydrolase family 35 protein [Enterococcus sp. LJL98]